MSFFNRHRTFILLYGSVFLYFMWPLILLQKTFIFGDYWQQHYPWAYEYARLLKTGALPYWVPQVANGFPLVAEGQVGAYYLPHLAMYLLLPFFAAYTWGIVLHLLAGGVGSYVYGQKMGLSKEASALLALLFSFSSAYGGCFSNTAVLRVMAWLPWCLFAWDRLCAASARKRFPWIGLLGLFFSQMATAGAPQMALYAGVYLTLLCLWQSRGRHWGGFLAAGALGALLSLPQWMAALELLPLSARAGETAAFALSGSVLPPSLAALFFPEWGTFLGLSFYLGAIPVYLLFVSMTSKKTRPEKIHLWLGIFFALLALGKYNPVYAFLVEKGSFTALRSPSKWLFFSVVSFSAASAFALDRLGKQAHDRRFLKNFQKTLIAVPALLLCAPFLAQTAFGLFRQRLADFARRSAEAVYAAKTDPWQDAASYQTRAGQMLERLEPLFSYSNPRNLAAIGFFLASAAVLWNVLKNDPRGHWRKIALPAVLAADLVVFGAFTGTGFTGNVRAYPEKLPESIAADIRERQAVDHSAVVGWPDKDDQEALPANVNLLYGLNHAGGYSPLILKHYYELSKGLGISDSSLGRRPYSEETWKRETGVLDALGVGQILSSAPLSLPGTRLVSVADQRTSASGFKDAQKLYLYERELVPPFARLTHEDPGAARGSVRLVSKKPLEVLLETEDASDAQLVLRSAYYPRWKAEVDGKPAPVVAADGAFSGIVLDKGKHAVRFYYDAGSHRLYEAIALAALLWLAVYALRLKRVQ